MQETTSPRKLKIKKNNTSFTLPPIGWVFVSNHKSQQHGGGGGGCQGTILTGIISEGRNFATSRNPEASCYFLVGSGWFLFYPGRLPMVPNISWWALDGNQHIFVPSLRLVRHCTYLNSQYSRASEFTVGGFPPPIQEVHSAQLCVCVCVCVCVCTCSLFVSVCS